MLAAYQAALNTFVNNRNPQQSGSQPQQQNSSASQSQSTGAAPAGAQQQQQQQSQQVHPNAVPAAAHQQAGMYAMHAAPMLAYMPVLVSLHTAHYLHHSMWCLPRTAVYCALQASVHVLDRFRQTPFVADICVLQLGVLAACPKLGKPNVV
jgi:hypothetical protein